MSNQYRFDNPKESSMVGSLLGVVANYIKVEIPCDWLIIPLVGGLIAGMIIVFGK